MADTLSMVKTIYFFKVPFDNTYKNVLSFPGFSDTSASTIILRLMALYDVFTYTIPNNKRISIKETNGKSVISISGSLTKPYKELKDYNYCAIAYDLGNNKTSYSFYFVTSYDSLNQGTIPSTLIQIEYDCWLNNYSKISTDDKQFTMVRGHKFDLLNTSGDTLLPKYNSVDADIRNYKINYKTTTPRILWIKLKLNSLTGFYTGSDGNYFAARFSSANTYSSQVPVVYAPIGVYISQNRAFASQNEYNFKVSNPTQTSVTYPIGNLLFALTTQNVIESAELTYFPPFPITYDSANKSFTIGNSDFVMSIFDLLTKDTSSGSDIYEHLFVSIGSFGGVICCTESYKKKVFTASIVYEKNITGILKQYYDGNAYVNAYPFKRYSLHVGSSIIPLIPPDNATNIWLMIHIVEELVEYKIIYRGQNDELLAESDYIPLHTIGLVTTIGDQSSLYFRNNANQMLATQEAYNAKFIMSTILNASNAMTNPISAVTGFANSAVNYYVQNNMLEAKKKDVNNMLNSVSNIGNDALQNVLYQNFPYLTEDECIKDDYYKTKIFELYKYGSASNSVDNLTLLPFKYFNYKQYYNFSAPYITNNKERETVESILSNGVFIWCDRFGASSADLNIIKNMQIVDGNKLTEVT